MSRSDWIPSILRITHLPKLVQRASSPVPVLLYPHNLDNPHNVRCTTSFEGRCWNIRRIVQELGEVVVLELVRHRVALQSRDIDAVRWRSRVDVGQPLHLVLVHLNGDLQTD